ncbi:uncharacterized protein LOC62_01G000483 [Vanrija pseudolonga]|uniref:Uncharacterized protein n=1 Tax=Vanrija pseudolonga TaxID=143232 RepID=A0AAF0Y2R1_9TREE|nr:hypothetical protein LOC62_01G000483 [Vanrija pseudolonga]
MPAPILSSQFLTLEVVETALKGVSEPSERVKLLSAKVHLLQEAAAAAARPPPATPTTTSDTSAPPRPPRPSPVPLLAARADLADAYLLLTPPDLHAAEAECLAAQAECRRLLKRQGDEGWRPDVGAIRERVLALLVAIEEGLGRPARAERWRGLMSG